MGGAGVPCVSEGSRHRGPRVHQQRARRRSDNASLPRSAPPHSSQSAPSYCVSTRHSTLKTATAAAIILCESHYLILQGKIQISLFALPYLFMLHA